VDSTGKETRSEHDRGARGLGFLLCDVTGIVEPGSFEGPCAGSAIQCLEKAVEDRPGIIAVRFGGVSVPERETLVELCIALKRNRQTRGCRVLALLDEKHRAVLEELARAGVEFARYMGEGPLDAGRLREAIDGLGPDDGLDRRLAPLCPFLHYERIDSRHELTVCGAYLDRLILGGRRLKDVCLTEGHLRCEHYLHPRRTP